MFTEISQITLENESKFYEAEQLIYESAVFPTIFYSKRDMKSLLSQRNNIYQILNIKKLSKPSQQQYKIIVHILLEIFQQAPSEIDHNYFTIFRYLDVDYALPSADGKYAPLCKICNHSVYISIYNLSARVLCGNKHCSRKLLGQFSLKRQNTTTQKLSKHTTQRKQSLNSQQKSKNNIQQKNKLSLNDKLTIEKVTKKIIYQ